MVANEEFTDPSYRTSKPRKHPPLSGALSCTEVGMTIEPWSGRAVTEALRQVRAYGQDHGIPCAICRQPINYGLEYPHPQSCSVQHVKPRHLYPHLTWDPSNWAPSHLDCNKGERTIDRDGLGAVSDW